MALTTADPTDVRPRNEREEADDPVIADWRALQKSLERTPEELMIESINSIARNRQSGTLTAEEADALLRQLAAAVVEARLNDALFQYVMPSTRERWGTLRHFRRSFLAHRGSETTP